MKSSSSPSTVPPVLSAASSSHPARKRKSSEITPSNQLETQQPTQTSTYALTQRLVQNSDAAHVNMKDWITTNNKYLRQSQKHMDDIRKMEINIDLNNMMLTNLISKRIKIETDHQTIFLAMQQYAAMMAVHNLSGIFLSPEVASILIEHKNIIDTIGIISVINTNMIEQKNHLITLMNLRHMFLQEVNEIESVLYPTVFATQTVDMLSSVTLNNTISSSAVSQQPITHSTAESSVATQRYSNRTS